MLIRIKDLDVIKLKTGEIGTVVHSYDDTHFTVEIEDGDLRDIDINEIENIVWEP